MNSTGLMLMNPQRWKSNWYKHSKKTSNLLEDIGRLSDEQQKMDLLLAHGGSQNGVSSLAGIALMKRYAEQSKDEELGSRHLTFNNTRYWGFYGHSGEVDLCS